MILIMRVLGVQFDIAWEDRHANHAKARSLLERDPPPTGTLVVLPEMFPSGFSMNVAKIAQDDSRPDERFVAELCKRLKIWCIAGVVSRGAGGRGRNEAVAFDPDGKLVARYCKIHPFSLGDEDHFYEAGSEVVTFECNGFTIAPFVCYDLRFPEVFRIATQRGANVFAVIANWPAPRAEQRMILLRARAIENQAYVIGVNRVGDDPKLHYSGETVIISPRGEVLATGEEREGLVSAEIDLSSLNDYRASMPFLRDMRSEFISE